MKTKRFKAEFLSKEETKALKEFNLSVRQLGILDIMKSYHITTNNNGRFTLSTVQLAEQIKVSERTLERDIISLVGKGILEKTKVKVNGVKWLVNEYFVPLFNIRQNTQFNTRQNNNNLSYINPLNNKELEALLTPLINTRQNTLEMSHSNSISNSKSNNTIIPNINNNNYSIITTPNNTKSETIGENKEVITNLIFDNMENNNTYQVELTVDNFKIITDDITQLTEEVIDKVVEKFNYIQSKVGKTTVKETIPQVEEGVEEELEEIGNNLSIEENSKTIPTNPTSNSNTNSKNSRSKLGSLIIDRIKQRRNELYKEELSFETERKCLGNNEYAKVITTVNQLLEERREEFTDKQVSYIKSLLEDYAKLLQSKLDNIRKHCTKSRNGEVKVLGVNRVDETKKEYDQAAKELLRNSFNRALESKVSKSVFSNGVYNYLKGFALSTAEKKSIRDRIEEEYGLAEMATLREDRLKKTTPTTETKVVEEETKANSSSIFNFRNLGLEEIEKSREEALDEICKTSHN